METSSVPTRPILVSSWGARASPHASPPKLTSLPFLLRRDVSARTDHNAISTFVGLDEVEKEHRKAAKAVESVSEMRAKHTVPLWPLLCREWSSAMAWQRMGRLHQWRRGHGGFQRTMTKATVWIFFGLFGSLHSEIAFLIAFRFIPSSVSGAPHFMLWFRPFSFLCYAPLFAIWAWTRRHV